MIGRIAAAMAEGSKTVAELSRQLDVEPSALEQMLRFMIRKGMVRELHAECRAGGCRGCRHHGRCDDLPVTGYELVAPTERK